MDLPRDYGIVPLCWGCARLGRVEAGVGYTCDAFRGGIPVEIMASVHDHREPYEGDGGLTFEPKGNWEKLADAIDAEWEESKHPRGKSGKFASSGTSGKGVGEEGSPHARRWAQEGEEKGLVSVYKYNAPSDPSLMTKTQYEGLPIVYHGTRPGHKDAGFLFVTQSKGGAKSHGEVSEYRIRPGARLHPDLEGGTEEDGYTTLLGSPKYGGSSGIVHVKDLIPNRPYKEWRNKRAKPGEDELSSLATDPPVSEAQRRAMFAAKAGHSNIGIPQSVGSEFAESDPGGKLPEKVSKDLAPRKWSLLKRLFGEWMDEEEAEPEHQGVDGWDTWSPEAREAAAEARHLHATATHEKGAGHGRFAVQAGSHKELEGHLGNLHKHAASTGGNYNVHIENKRSGEVHSARVSPQGVHQRSYNEQSFDESEETKARHEGKLSEKTREDEGEDEGRTHAALLPTPHRMRRAGLPSSGWDAALAFDWTGAAVLSHSGGLGFFDFKTSNPRDFDLAYDRESARKYDDDGHLHVADVNIAKASVNEYLGKEIPGSEELGLDPDRKYRLWRHPDELKRAVASANGKPILNDHEAIDAESHDPRLVVGSIGTDARWDAPFVKAGLTFWPAKASREIESNQRRALSPAYRYRPDMGPGRTPEGEPYDGVMRDISFSHLAQIPEGRQGPDIVVRDSAEELQWEAIAEAIRGLAGLAA